MPSEYHAFYTLHPCLTQDQSKFSNQQLLHSLRWHGVTELQVKGSHCTMLNTIMVACVFFLLVFGAALISCGGSSGGSIKGANGSNTPTVDGNAKGGQRNPVCFAGKSSDEVARPPTAQNIDSSGPYLSRIEHISEFK